jgi:glycine/D-amino acid oxidase-like deaminating enzyme
MTVCAAGGMGGLTTAAKLIEKGAKVVLLEKYLLPGKIYCLGSSSSRCSSQHTSCQQQRSTSAVNTG